MGNLKHRLPTIISGKVHGRNMDGETDPKRVTVRDLIVIARDGGGPSFPFISVTWPGHIGVLSGMRKYGRYSLMLNCGSMAPGEGVTQDTKIAPVEFLLRAAMEGGIRSSDDFMDLAQEWKSKLGGLSEVSILVANGDLGAYVVETDGFDVVPH